jgi:hypothetical protein
MEKSEKFAASAFLILESALDHLERASSQNSVERAREDIAQAVLEIGRVVELAQALLARIPEPTLH